MTDALRFRPLSLALGGLLILAGAAVLAGCDRSGESASGPASAEAADSASENPASENPASQNPASGAAHGAALGAADAASGGRVFDVQAVTLDARDRPGDSLLVRLRDLGATHVTLIPFGWQSAPDTPAIRMHTDGGWYSESDAGIRAIARQADTLGMGVILKPHIWVRHGQSRSRIGFATDADWRRWEEHYHRFMMHYARLAADIDASILVLGTELSRSVTRRPSFWRALAADVRAAYDGRLTYAANWHEGYRRLPFWDVLDYVGVQAYFPLAEAESPSVDALADGWRRHRRALRRVHEATGRPVLFTEVGYRSVAQAAAEPWTWPEREEEARAPVDRALQARCYRAFFSSFARTPWFAGAVLWKWHPAAEGDRPVGFTPQNKPAEHVIQQWFTGQAPGTAAAGPGAAAPSAARSAARSAAPR
jgi:hypothetical protein